MTQSAFAIGAKVSCTDGDCGKLVRVVVNPVAGTVTHLVVEHWHERTHARLVPIELADSSGSDIKLHCTKAAFDDLPLAEERDFIAGSDHPHYGRRDVLSLPYFSLGGIGMAGDWTEGQGWDAGGSHGTSRKTYTHDSVPVGEVQVRRHDSVRATDGEIGVVEGLVLDSESHEVTHVLLQEGHLWGRKEVAIPIGAVTGVETGIHLNLSKQQVEELPAVPVNRSQK